MPTSRSARGPSWRICRHRLLRSWRRATSGGAEKAATAAAVIVVLATLSIPAGAQHESGPLAAARDLYASARYDEALAVLNGMNEHADRRSVEKYRSLCLLALGRAPEAEVALAAVVTADPAYQPGEAEASPRVLAMFTEVRRRLLPGIATARYVAAKATYDRGEWEVAEQQFRVALSLIDDPDSGGRLADLRLLAVGFLELSARAAAPPAEPPAEPEPLAAVQEPLPIPGSGHASPDPDKIYVAEDAGVALPVALRQEIPDLPAAVRTMAKPRGLLDIVIDERGRVVEMTVRQSIHPAYDSQILIAARDWKYEPATMQGAPVKFRKLIHIAVKR